MEDTRAQMHDLCLICGDNSILIKKRELYTKFVECHLISTYANTAQSVTCKTFNFCTDCAYNLESLMRIKKDADNLRAKLKQGCEFIKAQMLADGQTGDIFIDTFRGIATRCFRPEVRVLKISLESNRPTNVEQSTVGLPFEDLDAQIDDQKNCNNQNNSKEEEENNNHNDSKEEEQNNNHNDSKEEQNNNHNDSKEEEQNNNHNDSKEEEQNNNHNDSKEEKQNIRSNIEDCIFPILQKQKYSKSHNKIFFKNLKLRYMFKCNYCSKIIRAENSKSLAGHIDATHLNNSKFQCGICYSIFFSKKNCRSHLVECHKDILRQKRKTSDPPEVSQTESTQITIPVQIPSSTKKRKLLVTAGNDRIALPSRTLASRKLKLNLDTSEVARCESAQIKSPFKTLNSSSAERLNGEDVITGSGTTNLKRASVIKAPLVWSAPGNIEENSSGPAGNDQIRSLVLGNMTGYHSRSNACEYESEGISSARQDCNQAASSQIFTFDRQIDMEEAEQLVLPHDIVNFEENLDYNFMEEVDVFQPWVDAVSEELVPLYPVVSMDENNTSLETTNIPSTLAVAAPKQWVKPNLSYTDLIILALVNSESSDMYMRVEDIYQFIAENYPFYNELKVKHISSIRRILSVDDRFKVRGSANELFSMYTIKEELLNACRDQVAGVVWKNGTKSMAYPARLDTMLTNICSRTSQMEAGEQDMGMSSFYASDYFQLPEPSSFQPESALVVWNPAGPASKKKRQRQGSISGWPRPPFTYAQLTVLAILSSEMGNLNVVEIVQFYRDLFPYYASFKGLSRAIYQALYCNRTLFNSIGRNKWGVNTAEVAKVLSSVGQLLLKDRNFIVTSMLNPEKLDEVIQNAQRAFNGSSR